MTPNRFRAAARRASWIAATVLVAGCGLLDTEQPNIIEPGDLDTPEGAEAKRVGALADFAFVNDGDGTQEEDGLILLSGLLSDEFVLSTTPPSEQEIDQRTTATINPSLSDVYRNLHRARAGAERAEDALRTFDPDVETKAEVAELLAVAGFTYVYFAENFCSGVPFSRFVDGTIEFAPSSTTAETYAIAIAKFDSALADPGLAEADDGTIANLAAIGKGRALLDLGQFADAAVAVQDVPTDFRYVTEHAQSPFKLQNAIWSYTNQGLWSVANLEGENGLAFVDDEDPRVPTFDTEDTGLDLVTPQFNLLKYPDASASVVVADGIEARLIEAEAQLALSARAAMTGILNDLRATVELADLPVPGTNAAARTVLFRERAFWLYATGHRLGDLRRLIRQYGLDTESVFPTGLYHKTGSYGVDVNLPIPIEEQNNPNFTGCLDRAP